MTREEYKEAMGIAMQMKASGQIEVLIATPLASKAASEVVTMARPSTQIPNAPYVVISEVQPIVVQLAQKEKDEAEVSIIGEQGDTPSNTRKSKRLVKVKQEAAESPSMKRTKHLSSGLGKRRKTL